MSSEPVISLKNLSKCYHIFDKPRDRLLQMLVRGRRQYFREFWALKNINLDIMPGQVVGVIGANGAGKSTLLQLVCGTLAPTSGDVVINGRVAALLELGSGFNPEFTGRENVYLSASILGLSQAEIDSRYGEIVAFSGIGEFLDQPVKTYSSGMYVRLAFSVATSVDPDILVVDEALSVGDDAFTRKSFDRIMALKNRGVTILFCSHSLYQVEAFCDYVLWLDSGECKDLGDPQTVISDYKSFIVDLMDDHKSQSASAARSQHPDEAGQGYFIDSIVAMDGVVGNKFKGKSNQSVLSMKLTFYLDPNLPPPVIGVNIDYGSVVAISSIVSRTDGIEMIRNDDGYGAVEINLPNLALRKGVYFVSVYLGCENAIHIYDNAVKIASFEMVDPYPEPGLVNIPHEWKVVGSDSKQNELLPVKLPWGHFIETDLLDSLGLRSAAGNYELSETALCRLLVKPGDSVLDIGANIGYYSLLFGCLVTSTGKVTAIEPDAENFKLLQRNIQKNGLDKVVDACQIALGDVAHISKLYRSEESGGHHRLYSSVCCGSHFVNVNVDVGDNLNLGELDFVKIDIEGYEPVAMKGLSNTIKQSPNLKVLCEFSPLSIWEAGSSPIAFLQEMSSLGLSLITLESGKWVETNYKILLDELEKIPELAVTELINYFADNHSSDIIFERAEAFLAKNNYSRPLLENIVLVASAAWESVLSDLASA